MAIKDESTIASRLTQAFQAKDLKEVAAILEVKYPSLHNWTSGRRDFPTQVLTKIAKMTNTSLNWLLTGKEEHPVSPLDSNAGLDEAIREFVTKIVRTEVNSVLEERSGLEGSHETMSRITLDKRKLPKAKTSLDEVEESAKK